MSAKFDVVCDVSPHGHATDQEEIRFVELVLSRLVVVGGDVLAWQECLVHQEGCLLATLVPSAEEQHAGGGEGHDADVTYLLRQLDGQVHPLGLRSLQVEHLD